MAGPIDFGFDFSGRVALVTGAGSGIGQAAALLLARMGANVGLLGRTEEELRESCETAADIPRECLPIVADVSDSEAVRAGVEALVDRFGRLDIVFANAGVNGVWAPIDELTVEEFDTTQAINLRGTFVTIKHAVPHLRRQGGGSIVVTSSVNGTRIFSNTGATAYSVSKAGQVAMTKMLAVELARDRIRVNAVCPGAIATRIGENTEQRNTDAIKIPVEFPEGEIPLTGDAPGTSQQVARLVAFLASDLADHITGEVVYIDGGQSLLQG